MRKIVYWIIGVILVVGLSSIESTARMQRTQKEKQKKQEVEKKKEEEVYTPKPYKGLKKRIAVAGFENKSNWRGDINLGEGMAEMLTTALHKTGRFIIVERQALNDILREQRLAEERKVLRSTAPKVGRLIGAQVLIRGAVTEYESTKTGGLGGIGVGGIGIGIGGKVAHVAIDLRIYDSSTGEVLQSHRAVGEAKTTGLALGGVSGDVTFGGAGFWKTPLGEATRKAITDAVDFIVREMEKVSWQSSIITVKDDLIYITGGEDMNIHIGDKFKVYSVGEELIDPISGLSLGREEKKIGKIEVVEVKEKYAKAKILHGSGFKRGDAVRTK
ncbi:MAG TPA: hypothetical protein EYP78_03775 [Candidatus Omnitrophica bacterium]|nr:hypothetical protein [Candidatus Omnitrophota bacterium]